MNMLIRLCERRNLISDCSLRLKLRNVDLAGDMSYVKVVQRYFIVCWISHAWSLELSSAIKHSDGECKSGQLDTVELVVE